MEEGGGGFEAIYDVLGILFVFSGLIMGKN